MSDVGCGSVHQLLINKTNVSSLAISPDGKSGLLGHREHQVQLWKATSGTTLQHFKCEADDVAAIAINRGQMVATASSRGWPMQPWDEELGYL
jgi:WD40 repeat protein